MISTLLVNCVPTVPNKEARVMDGLPRSISPPPGDQIHENIEDAETTPDMIQKIQPFSDANLTATEEDTY